jgi:phosphoribosylaminoimidazolecarboxamide formyltransferase/IMP cyclohydrolase
MPTALLSVYDKTDLLDFAHGLHKLGWTLLASGGTALVLRSAGLPVVEVADYTGSPEILGGRVKTLHPAIHAGILARSRAGDIAQVKEQRWELIDMVVVNLYPFEETITRPGVNQEEALENIDIGGVALIRAAAKNHDRVLLLCDPSDYGEVIIALQTERVFPELRRRLALKGFQTTAQYDFAITAYFSGTESFHIQGYAKHKLRYGENPHQTAQVYAYQIGSDPLGGKVLQGKELSYTNLLDLDAAWRAVLSFEKPTICIVKHLSPCGIASSDIMSHAYLAALNSDPVSAFGGVIGSNRSLDGETADKIKELFIECVIAPGFDPMALETLGHKKNCRLLEMPDTHIDPQFEIRSINHGFLVQQVDMGDPNGIDYKVVSTRAPNLEEREALTFAWKACQHVKSNAIGLAQGESTVGIGSGQPNRVDSVRISIRRAGDRARGSVMASDAFFPFPDSIKIAAEAGITAVIQPGGSLRDADSIAAADSAGMAMVFTGVRHFRH